MANKKITDLTELTEAASDDYLEIVDTSANTSKKISLENLIAGHDHDSDYLGISAKAADSDKLDGKDSTDFSLATHNHDTAYLGITAKAADSDKLDGLDSTDFGRPVFLTTPLTSTSWDGDTKGTGDRAIVDLSAVFGVPAGVKAVLISVQTQADAVNDYIRFGPNSTYSYALTCRTAVAGQIAIAMGIVPCDSNGDIYCYPSATIAGVQVWIWGYWL